MRIRRLEIFAALAVSATLGACSDSNMGEVSLRLSTRSAEAAAAPGQLSISLGPDEIVVDHLQIVLRKIRLDGAPTASCPEDGEGDSQCGEVRLGPVLFDLPLGDEAEPTFTAQVPVGSYDEFKFQIHKPSNANGDADLVAAHPEMEDISIRATGTFNGTAFIFVTDLTEVEEVALSPTVEVTVDGTLPLTLHIDASAWFVNQAGTGLVDPAQASEGQPFESVVEQNIRQSFRAFHDGDADGLED